MKYEHLNSKTIADLEDTDFNDVAKKVTKKKKTSFKLIKKSKR
jgi:hypothetical protein